MENTTEFTIEIRIWGVGFRVEGLRFIRLRV